MKCIIFYYNRKVLYKGGLKTSSKYPFESSNALDGIKLSLVVPSYNEEKRLGKMISSTINYFDAKGFKYEIIMVNDGSKDKTWELIQDIINNRFPKHELLGINYTKNAGKGFAVRTV